MVVCINYNNNYENCWTNLVVATRACCRFIMSCPYGSDVQRDDALGQLAAGAYLCMYVCMYVCMVACAAKHVRKMIIGLVFMHVRCMYLWAETRVQELYSSNRHLVIIERPLESSGSSVDSGFADCMYWEVPTTDRQSFNVYIHFHIYIHTYIYIHCC